MKSFSLGTLTVYHFGLLVALAALAAFLWMGVSARGKLKSGTVSVFALLALPLGVLGGRLLLCLVSQGWYLFRQNFFFNTARGGFMLYGVMAGAVLALFLTARITGEKAARIADAAAAPGALIIALCRLGEGYMGVGYGRSIVEWFDPWMEQSLIAWEEPDFLCQFPFGIPDYYDEWHFSIFLLEAIAALVIAVLVCRRKGLLPGGRIALMLLLYASCQALFESMRADSIPRWGFVRINQLISGIMVAGVLLVGSLRLGKRIPAKQHTVAWIGTLGCIGMVMVMEFALEQKISFLRWMRMDVCYFVMALACVGLILFVRPVWRTAFTDEG